MAPSQSQNPILIAGAGLASLLLAQSLLRSKIPFRIFERDRDVSFRAQGYRLRLSREGLDAIEEVLGEEDWKVFWETCGKTGGSAGGLGVVDVKTGEIIDAEGGPVGGKPNAGGEKEKEEEKEKEKAKERETDQELKEKLTSRDGKVVGISRGDMRKLFLKNCEPFISWGKAVTGYEVVEDGVVALFKDGSKSEVGSLLVGGEGIYSKVAKQVSNGLLKVYDTGARGIHGQSPTTAFKGLGEGVWRLVDKSSGVFLMTNVRARDMDDPSLEFGWTLGGPAGAINAPGNDFSLIGRPAAEMAKSFTRDWHPKFQPLFAEMKEDEAAFWKITCSTPSGVPEWENAPRVTVLGDAAHSMTPAGGIGANTAVRDSALLGRLLREAGGWREGVTAEYERGMRVYASEAVVSSYRFAEAGMGVKIDANSKEIER